MLHCSINAVEMLGEMVIRWTARLAVACYAARLICDATDRSRTSLQQLARWWWTIGCAWFLVHVAAAFHFEHHWSHAAAFAHTSQRTAEMTGWNSGIGLYVNEAFLCLWLTDTILWWRNLSWPQNPWAYGIVQGIFGFLMIQATAVFGPPFWKPVVVLILALISFQVLRPHGPYDETNPAAESSEKPPV